MLLPPDKIASLLRHYGRCSRHRPAPSSLTAIAGIACLSFRTVMYARKGVISTRTRRLLSYALDQICNHPHVWPAAHRSTIEELSDVTGFRT